MIEPLLQETTCVDEMCEPDTTQNSNRLQQMLIEAIENQNLRLTLWHLEDQIAEFTLPEQQAFKEVMAAVNGLDDEVLQELTRLVLALRKSKNKVWMAGLAYPDRLLHILKLNIMRRHVDRAAAVLADHGYQCEHRSSGNYWQHFLRYSDSAIFTSPTGSQFRVILKWQVPYKFNHRLVKAVWPKVEDFKSISLPAFLWPAYTVVRCFRRFFGSRKPSSQPVDLGVFLGTPESLILPLLEFAGVDSTDYLFDLGSGDGRVLISAATEYGCHCLGYEFDPRLVELFNKKLDESETQSKLPIEIICGDAMSADLSEATVVFLFLPVATLRALVPELLKKMKPGARLVVHEQERLRIDPAPDQSIPLISRSGVTVAHKWIVPSA